MHPSIEQQLNKQSNLALIQRYLSSSSLELADSILPIKSTSSIAIIDKELFDHLVFFKWYQSKARRDNACPRTELKWLFSQQNNTYSIFNHSLWSSSATSGISYELIKIKPLLSRLVVVLSRYTPEDRETLLFHEPWLLTRPLFEMSRLLYIDKKQWNCRLENLSDRSGKTGQFSRQKVDRTPWDSKLAIDELRNRVNDPILQSLSQKQADQLNYAAKLVKPHKETIKENEEQTSQPKKKEKKSYDQPSLEGEETDLDAARLGLNTSDEIELKIKSVISRERLYTPTESEHLISSVDKKLIITWFESVPERLAWLKQNPSELDKDFYDRVFVPSIFELKDTVEKLFPTP